MFLRRARTISTLVTPWPYSACMPDDDASLIVRRDPRLAQIASALILFLVVGVGVWYANSPRDLPTAPRAVQASTPVGQPVYVGVFAPSQAFGRTLTISGIKVATTSNTQVEVVPLLCRRGTVGVTSDPAQFCMDVVNPEGESFGPGDDIVLEVTSQEPAVAVIERIRVGFREGLQWGTEEAGAPVIVRVLGR